MLTLNPTKTADSHGEDTFCFLPTLHAHVEQAHLSALEINMNIPTGWVLLTHIYLRS